VTAEETGRFWSSPGRLIWDLLFPGVLEEELGGSPLMIRRARETTRLNWVWYTLGLLFSIMCTLLFPSFSIESILFAVSGCATVFCVWTAWCCSLGRKTPSRIEDLPLPLSPYTLYISGVASSFRVALVFSTLYFLFASPLILSNPPYRPYEELFETLECLTWSLVLPGAVLMAGALGLRAIHAYEVVLSGIASLAAYVLLVPAAHALTWFLLGLTYNPSYWRHLTFVGPLWAMLLALRLGPWLVLRRERRFNGD
jgi:hypothetical protein